MRHERGEAVVVAVADLVVGNRVVLVHDRDHAQVEEPAERLACVEVLRALDEVVRREEHLAGDELVLGQDPADALHELGLADGGDGLQRADVRRPARQREGREARRDGSRAHEDELVPGAVRLGELAAELEHGAVVELARLVRDRGRPDLDDDLGPRRVRSRHQPTPSTYSSSTGPTRTVSPSCAPARARARSTPIRRKRSWTYATASSFVRSAMATTRSADLPVTRHAPSLSRTTEKPSSTGRSTTNGSRSGSALRASATIVPSVPTNSSRPSCVTADRRGPSKSNSATSALLPMTRRGRSSRSGR